MLLGTWSILQCSTYFGAIAIFVCPLVPISYGVEFKPYGDPCADDAEVVGDTAEYREIAERLSSLINFSVDPCDDFQRFMCRANISPLPSTSREGRYREVENTIRGLSTNSER
ncbi:hypothetical protein Y032_0105g3712 [Ancylostoma ceylanicum]|uniref:Peptidase M13 N-terminal domain-containing protein n=1 Tax=Ancylostoma ceylanicum TaxID=53326 RepID=A0A016TFK2_9BILA|nr:hypothetical protein Y032_0105g3712 [Ancylostoma ceylanicum]